MTYAFRACLLTLALASSAACTPEASIGANDRDGGGDAPLASDAPVSGDAPPASDAPDGDTLAGCYETFPEPPVLADGGAPGPSADGGLAGPPHMNPLEYSLGTVAVGEVVTGTVRYYNFCADPASAVVSTDPSGAAGDFVVRPPPAGPNPLQTYLRIEFRPSRAGEQRLVTRVRTNQGVYEVRFVGTGR